PAPPLHRPAPESKRNRPRRQILLNPENLLRLQRAVLVVLVDEMIQPAAVVMLHLAAPNISRPPVHDHVLMNPPLFVARLAMPEEADVPRWVIARMSEPLIQKNQISVDVKPILGNRIRRGDADQFIPQRRRNRLIGIENENPR